MSQRIEATGGDIVRSNSTEGGYELILDEDENFCTTIVLAIAEIRDVDPLEMPPLLEAHDPDNVNGMVSSVISPENTAPESLTFEFYGYEVVVDTDGTATIQRNGSTKLVGQ